MPILFHTDNNLSISFLQCFPDFILQMLDAFLLCGSDMGTCRHPSSAPLGIAEFQNVRQLIAVPGMHDHRQAVRPIRHPSPCGCLQWYMLSSGLPLDGLQRHRVHPLFLLPMLPWYVRVRQSLRNPGRWSRDTGKLYFHYFPSLNCHLDWHRKPNRI